MVGRTIPLILAALLTSVACDDRSSPTAPTDPLVGIWSGTIVDAVSGDGTLQVRLEEGRVTATGTWSAIFKTVSKDGTISGSAATSPIALVFRCSGGGTGGFEVTLVRERMTGKYFALSCPGLDTGTIDLAKR